MKLNVGDYVRTKYGKIGRIISFDKSICFDLKNAKENIEDVSYEEEMIVVDTHYAYEDEEDMYFKDDIVKSSPNIIDLIEVGDYVNGNRVVEHAYEPGRLFVENIYVCGKGQTTIEDYSYELTSKYCYDEPDFIKSVLTHEQFESMQYVVKE